MQDPNPLASRRQIATLAHSSPLDPSSCVVCRRCGYIVTLSRVHKMQNVGGVYCRGCGAVIGRDGRSIGGPDRK